MRETKCNATQLCNCARALRVIARATEHDLTVIMDNSNTTLTKNSRSCVLTAHGIYRRRVLNA